jgi:hypothetical protein
VSNGIDEVARLTACTHRLRVPTLGVMQTPR